LAAIAFSAAISAFAFAPAQAFEMSGVGGKLGYSNPEHLDGTTALGAHVEFEQPSTRVHLLPNVMYWNTDDVSNVNPNMDIYYHFVREGKVTPYVGGGVGANFVHDDRINHSDTDVGVNMMGGIRFPISTNHAFLEGRYTASDVNQVSLLTGLTFHTGR
jgi:opacity protein-like surface antigen